jgi:hypothetical protein
MALLTKFMISWGLKYYLFGYIFPLLYRIINDGLKSKIEECYVSHYFKFSGRERAISTPASTTLFVDNNSIEFTLYIICTNSTPTTIPEIIATAWTASLVGKLEMIDGCLRVISVENDTDYVLVWPPDYSITIDNNKVRVVSGIVTGNHREILLNIGETVKMSGGETEQLSEKMYQSLPSNCVGPYWIVGFEVTPFKPTEEPN